jgi:hypothetical protein
MKEIDVFLRILASLSNACPEIGTRDVFRLTTALKLAVEQNGCSQGLLKATLQETDANKQACGPAREAQLGDARGRSVQPEGAAGQSHSKRKGCDEQDPARSRTNPCID